MRNNTTTQSTQCQIMMVVATQNCLVVMSLTVIRSSSGQVLVIGICCYYIVSTMVFFMNLPRSYTVLGTHELLTGCERDHNQCPMMPREHA
jgi:hypothetical protein